MNYKLRKEELILAEGRVLLCALSGGADSVFMTSILLEKIRGKNIKLFAAHFNHSIRGSESDRDAEFVLDFCKQRDIELIIEKENVVKYARKKKLGTEEAARILRYEFLERAADKASADFILTAHNANDNAETILMNLVRGSGLRGLGGIPEQRGRVVRPILDISRREIISYLEKEGLPFVEDSTNEENIYRRNLMRNEIMPKLENINPEFTKAVSQTTVLLSEDEAFLDSIAEDFLSKGSEGSLSISKLKTLPTPILRRVIRKFVGSELGFEHVNSVIEQLEGEGLRRLDLPGKKIFFQYDSLSVDSGEGREIPKRILNPEERETYYIAELALEIKLQQVLKYEKEVETKNRIVFNSDRIYGNISLTPALAGDKLRLSKRRITKKISDLFSEAKLSAAERKLCPVLRDEKGPIFVYGFDKAERVAPKVGSPALRVEFIFKEEKESE